jgi:hypothetical protein
MPSPRTLKKCIWLLVVGLVFASGWTAYLLFQNFIWKVEARRYVIASAQLEAHASFRKGFLWLYKIDGECNEDHFSGNREGPFEVWIKFYQPSAGAAHRYTTELWVETFNDQMRRMQKEPEKFKKPI